MTKSLRSYPESERKKVVSRRLAKRSGGLGWLAAFDYDKTMEKRKAKKRQKAAEKATKQK